MVERASRNRTLSCTSEEIERLSSRIVDVGRSVTSQEVDGKVVIGDILEVGRYLPESFVDLLILDPPYNADKDFHGHRFKKKDRDAYAAWFRGIVELLVPMMKPDGTLYACADWSTSTIVAPILESYLYVRNRITWEREKGRGSRNNWKANAEDVWFCTKSRQYVFNVEAVKLRRKVRAPYRVDGVPKDWSQDEEGYKYRLTYPSNIWTDITVPFWSMAENTEHPTQKPEKMIAKLVLASSNTGDFVFDPFLGSGTTAVVAEKLSRRWCGVDINVEYLCWALKRLEAAKEQTSIQGYERGVFWERNSGPERVSKGRGDVQQAVLFS